MDFEKAYKEALERAKAGNPLDEVFPELKVKESEDERVRKEIVKFVATVKDIAKSGRNSWAVRKEDVEMCERFLAYLEKQKEQKLITVIPKFRKSDMVISTKNNRLTYRILNVGSINELGNPEYEVEIFTDGKADNPRNIHNIEIAKMDEWGKLIEQKPAEWSEDDEALIENVCTALKGYALHERIVNLEEHAYRLEEMSERLKSIRPQPHWKPSEEQIEALWKLMHSAVHLSNWDEFEKPIEAIYNGLKKL